MIRLSHFAAAALLSAGLITIGCENAGASQPTGDGKVAVKAAADATAAVAKIQARGDTKDKITGTVTFTKTEKGVKAVVHVMGLTPGKHGIHIHEKTDLSDAKLVGAGPHWNPGGHKHGGPGGVTPHHSGDLGNITADDKGHAMAEIALEGITLTGEKDGVVGHSVVIHAKEDDQKTDPAGASGDRIAGGVIELKKAEKAEK